MKKREKRKVKHSKRLFSIDICYTNFRMLFKQTKKLKKLPTSMRDIHAYIAFFSALFSILLSF